MAVKQKDRNTTVFYYMNNRSKLKTRGWTDY